MTALTIIWAVLLVPAFMLFCHYSIEWLYEDLEVVTNNDKVGMYGISALLAMGWPIIAVILIIKALSNYIDGNNG